MQPSSKNRFQSEYAILIAILLLALVNGLLFIFILPPWQHYDEPNHFEYIWLLADRGELPDRGDYDTGMRREVARSMLEHGFFDEIPLQPNLEDEKPWIGHYSQFDEPPLYYLLASLPSSLLPVDDVTSQLYLARLISLILFAILKSSIKNSSQI